MTKYQRRAIAGAILSAYLLIGTSPSRAEPKPGGEPKQTCQEDDPCWDCATMGNLICGPTLIPAVSIVRDEPIEAEPVTAG